MLHAYDICIVASAKFTFSICLLDVRLDSFSSTTAAYCDTSAAEVDLNIIGEVIESVFGDLCYFVQSEA